MSKWQMVWIVGTFKADMAAKIIITNCQISIYIKKKNLSILKKLKIKTKIPKKKSLDLENPKHEPRKTKTQINLWNSYIYQNLYIGIIVNLFESLEPRAYENLSNGLFVPNDPTLPIFCDVSLIASNDWRGGMFKMAGHTTEQERCIFVLWKLTIFSQRSSWRI